MAGLAARAKQKAPGGSLARGLSVCVRISRAVAATLLADR
jgi:hypothetical protein